MTEEPREITQEECGPYFSWAMGMIVARAQCVDCAAPYLAWIDGRNSGIGRPCPYEDEEEDGPKIRDLSHYHAFNDEPGSQDYPKWKIHREIIVHRTSWEGDR